MIDYDKPKFDVCVNCKHWDCYSSDKDSDLRTNEGECHRYPPQTPNINYVTDYGITVYEDIRCTTLMSHVFTFGCDWCGEFEPDDNPTFPEGIILP